MAEMMKTLGLLLFVPFCSGAFTVDEINSAPDPAHFLEDIVHWLRNKNSHLIQGNPFKHEDCMIVNFGYTQELPYHQLSLTSLSPISINLGSHGMNAPNRCWVALVDQSELKNMQNIFNTVESIGTEMQRSAYAVFLLGSAGTIEIVRNHWTPPVVQIGLNKGRSPSTVFQFTCERGEDPSISTLLLRNGIVNRPITEVCPYSVIKVATNNEYEVFEVNFNTMRDLIKYPMEPGLCWDWEILDTFFQNYNLTPHFFDNNFTWGWYDEEIGSWRGAVEMVRNNSADFGATMFGCSQERNSVIRCSHILAYGYDNFNTKAPGPLPPAMNLVRLFTPLVWGLILLSAGFFSLYLVSAANIGTHLGITSQEYEDFLVPFRLPVPTTSTTGSLFPRGFSANLMLMIWGLFAAVLSYGFLAIFRDILILPVFEKPVDTVRDVVEHGLIPFVLDGGFYQRDNLLDSPNADYQHLGSITVVPLNWDETWKIMRVGVIEDNTHVYVGSIGWYEKQLGDWHVSKDAVEGMAPFSVYILNKKMIHEEEMQRTLLYYTQSGLMLGLGWVGREFPDPPEKIQLAHLFIAYIILGGGTLLGVGVFILEIILASCAACGGEGRESQGQGNSDKEEDLVVEDIEG